MEPYDRPEQSGPGGRSPIGRGRALKPPPVRVRIPPSPRRELNLGVVFVNARSADHFGKGSPSVSPVRFPDVEGDARIEAPNSAVGQ
jgi:hypothetical protein